MTHQSLILICTLSAMAGLAIGYETGRILDQFKAWLERGVSTYTVYLAFEFEDRL